MRKSHVPLMRLFMLLGILYFCNSTVSAQNNYNFISGGIYYKIISSEEAAVTNNNDGGTYSGIVKVPSSVTYNGKTYIVDRIDNAAFYDCDDLTEVDLPNTITVLDSWAFYDCNNLVKCDIPESVKLIGYRTFSTCTSLKQLVIPDNVTYIGEECFFQDNFEKITFGKNVETIGSGAFVQCNKFTEITLPEKLKVLDDNVFFECQQLRHVTLPAELKKIGQSTFQRCYKLEEIDIPDSVETIGYGAFYYCIGLKRISFGKGVKDLGGYGTYNMCTGVRDIYSYNTVPPANAVFQETDQCNMYTQATLHLPSQEVYDAYKADANWSKFFDSHAVVDEAMGITNIDVNDTNDSLTKVYDLKGSLVYSGKGDYSLPSGIYIVNKGGKTIKKTIK